MAASSDEIEAVYHARYGGFRRAVTAVVGSPDVAHDVVQDGFAHALERRGQFRGGSLEAWIWTSIARKALVVFLRHFADLAYADIASLLDVSEGTVAATLAQAHADLRARLELEGVQS